MKLKRIFITIPIALLIVTGIHSCKEEKTGTTAEKTEEPILEADGFESIFDGKTLTGWKGDPNYWRVENGNLVGEVTPETLLKRNTFIVWQGGQPADFELKLEFKIAESGNSGINYRS